MNQLSLQSDPGMESIADFQAALQPSLDDEAQLALAGERLQRVHAAGQRLSHGSFRKRAASGRQTGATFASPTVASALRALAISPGIGTCLS